MFLLALAALIIVWLVWNFDHYRSQAELATAYAARVGCSCRFVEGRDMASCAGEFADMRLVSVAEVADARAVTARYPLLASARADHRGDFGCVLEPAV